MQSYGTRYSGRQLADTFGRLRRDANDRLPREREVPRISPARVYGLSYPEYIIAGINITIVPLRPGNPAPHRANVNPLLPPVTGHPARHECAFFAHKLSGDNAT